MKRIFAAMLAAVLLLGCSKSTSTEAAAAIETPEATVETTAEPTAEPTVEADSEKAAFYAAYPEELLKEAANSVTKISSPSEGSAIIAGTTVDGIEILQLIAVGLDYQEYATDGKIYIHYYADGETEVTGWYTSTTEEETVEEEEDYSFTLENLTYVDTENTLDHCTYEEDGNTYDAYFEEDGEHHLIRLTYTDQDLQIDYVYTALTIPQDLLDSSEITEEEGLTCLAGALSFMYGDTTVE